jgi:glycosyltransferase involved in cell wall biosynthesis
LNFQSIPGDISKELLKFLLIEARGVVVPTKFEASSLPVMEAQSLGKAVATSHVTSLPQLVGNSAIVFDPDNIDEIAEAMETLWNDDEKLRWLEIQSVDNMKLSSWKKTVTSFIEVYKENINSKRL